MGVLDDCAAAEGYTEATLSLGNAHAGNPAGAYEVLDARQPQFSVAESEEALAQLAQKAGPASEAIARRVNESFVPIRSELNAQAGGQASARVMLLAHHAYRTELALELATSTSLVFHGRFAEEGFDKGQTDKALRNVVGIAAFATDLLNKAYAAAEAEGKAKAGKLGPVGELMQTLGVASEGPESSPVSTPGVGAVGAPLPSNPGSQNPAPSFGPLSQPKPTPAAPGLNLDPESPSVFAAPLPKKPPRRKADV